jgi:GAF domain-containing protein/HAMP domain-containing protein
MSSQFFSSAEKRQTTWRDSLNNVRLSWKLIMLASVMLLGSIGVSIVSGSGLNRLQVYLTRSYDLDLQPLLSIQEASTALAEAETYIEPLKSAFLLTTDDISHRLKEIVRLEKIYEDTMSRYQTQWKLSTRPGFVESLEATNSIELLSNEAKAIASLLTSYEDYKIKREALFALVQQGSRNPVSLIETQRDVIDNLTKVRDNLARLKQVNIQVTEASQKAADLEFSATMRNMLATIIVAAIIGIALAFLISQSIATRLEVVERSAALMRQGRFTRRAEVTGRDEIANLATSFNIMASQLNETMSGLEERVAERTKELEKRTHEIENTTTQLTKRASQLQAIADVSREIAQVQELSTLLPKITDVVSQRFGFYHAGIFLLDAKKEYAILRAANSVGGKLMLANGHKLKIGETGLVGYVGKTGRPRIALSTGEDAVYFNNPYLPETQSEMTLPLKIGDRVIGALDVQSKATSAFLQEDIAILSVLADQISVAVENARLFEESRRATLESEKAYQQFLRQERKTLQAESEIVGYMYSESGATSLAEPVKLMEFDQTAQSGRMIARADETSPALLSVPIKLRDDVIGVLGIRATDTHDWDQDEIDIVQAVAERVAVSIESARLLESSRRRATKEQLIGSITSRIGASINMRAVLQTAVEELGRVLPGSEVSIRLQSASDSVKPSEAL